MEPSQDPPPSPPARTHTRRRLLAVGVAGLAVVAAGALGLELVNDGVLPGQDALDNLDGACDVPETPLVFGPLGPTRSGTFFSRARNTTVGYTIAWPPGHGPGDVLPLIVMLHGEGANHRSALYGMTPAQAVALRVDGKPLPPMGMVTVDGGLGYWNPHPGDDPMGMVVDELIPMCQALGLGRTPAQIGTMGISMGGYGAILFGERYPQVFRAVAAISPAIWTSFDQARAVNTFAYASAADFAACDAVTHAGALAGTPVRAASGVDDPFHPGVVAFAKAAPASTEVVFSAGCHTGPFFKAQEPPSLAFLGMHLAS